MRSFQGTWLACAEPDRLFDRWYGILDMYSSMDISYDSDRLPALSGLAKRFQEFGCGDYVAGIWRQSVLDDIGWVGSGMISRPVTTHEQAATPHNSCQKIHHIRQPQCRRPQTSSRRRTRTRRSYSDSAQNDESHLLAMRSC